MTKFTHQFGDTVKMNQSGEVGEVIARAEFQHSEPSYLVRYCAGDGNQVENWWGESAIEPA